MNVARARNMADTSDGMCKKFHGHFFNKYVDTKTIDNVIRFTVCRLCTNEHNIIPT